MFENGPCFRMAYRRNFGAISEKINENYITRVGGMIVQNVQNAIYCTIILEF
jgi:hypothetical protein